MLSFTKGAMSCAVTAVLMAASTPVFADTTPAAVKTKRIAHNDLDLSSPKDQNRLHMRVRSAAKQVCGPRGFSLAETMDIARCEGKALAQAVPKVERSIARAQESKRLATNDTAIVGN